MRNGTGASGGGDRARIDAVFAEVLDRSPEERAQFLDSACGDNADLRAEVEALVRLAAAPCAPLEPTAMARGPFCRELWDALAAGEAADSGRHIGPWRLVAELGRGGMGVVYMAERSDGEFDQRVAIKRVHAAVDSGDMLHRFERERQILASLAHPNIARLLDGGRSEDGRPFLVMEYVEGRAIDRHCDEERLTIEERLALFLQVAHAVQHAHANLIVHRDIKPANVVVTPAGQVKLLDFGIARLLSPEGTPAGPPTRTAARALTPEYATPEQLLGRPATTASDVYQLGLLLYELLTGRRAQRPDGRTHAALERAICETPATRPSADVVAAASVDAAHARRTTPAALARRLRGDLDVIVLTALRKEPERRYPSVERLVSDVERHLRCEPVTARGDSLLYRSRKLVGRHRVAMSAAVIAAAALLAGLVGVAWQAQIASRERDRARQAAARAERVTEFLVGVFEISAPERAQGREVPARELLDRSARRIEQELANEPELQSALLDVMGRVYRSLGRYDEATRLLERAAALQRNLPNGDPAAVASTLLHLGQVLHDKSEVAAAESLYREALEIRQRVQGPVHASVAEALSSLGRLYHWKSDLPPAERFLTEALTMRQRLHGEEHPDVANSLADLGRLFFQQREYEKAEPLQRQALAIRERHLGARHPLVAASLNDLGSLLQNTGRLEDSERHYRRALDLKREVLGPKHPDTLWQVNNLGSLFYQRGQYAEAEPLFRETLEMGRTILGNDHPYIATYLMNLGACARKLGRVEEALAHAKEAVAIRVARYGRDHNSLALPLYHYALAERDLGAAREAAAVFQRALTIARKAHGRTDPVLVGILVDYGELLLDVGRLTEAEPLLREGLAARRERLGEDHWQTAVAQSALGALRARRGATAEASELLAAATATLQKTRPDAPETKRATARLEHLRRSAAAR